MTFPQRKGPSGPRAQGEVGAISRVTLDTAVADLEPLVLNVPKILPIDLEFDSPDPARYYSAQTDFDLYAGFGEFGTDEAGTIRIEIQRSVDAGPWLVAATTDADVFPACHPRHVTFALVPTLGSALGLVPGSASLAVRVVITKIFQPATPSSFDFESPGPDGTFALSFTEHNNYEA
jgi:hypothetical protein